MARQKNLSQEQIKIWILSYLYHQDEGANQHTIQFRALRGRTQEASRFKKLLEELCVLDRIQQKQVDTGKVAEGRTIYKITDKGRRTIESIRDPIIKDFLGLEGQEI